MLMQEERELIVEYGKKLSASGLCPGTSGNISIYNAEKNLMAISPSGMDYLLTQPEDIVITDLEANIADGSRKPSSEWALHTIFYKHKPEARAVVHTHSAYCTTFAVLNQPIRAVHYVIGRREHRRCPLRPVYHLRHRRACGKGHRGLRRFQRRTSRKSRHSRLRKQHRQRLLPRQQYGIHRQAPVPRNVHRPAADTHRRADGRCHGEVQILRPARQPQERILIRQQIHNN